MAKKAAKKASAARKPAVKPAAKPAGRSGKGSAAPARKPAARVPAARPPAPTPAPRLTNKKPLKLAVAAAPPAKPVRVSSGLSARDIEQFRQMLLEKRAQLARDVGSLQDEALRRSRQEASGDLSSMPIHMADLGSDNFEQEFTLGLIEGEQQVLREINEALGRIERGEYGICVATGQPIGKARLKAKPWAKYCYEYMLAQERAQHRRF